MKNQHGHGVCCMTTGKRNTHTSPYRNHLLGYHLCGQVPQENHTPRSIHEPKQCTSKYKPRTYTTTTTTTTTGGVPQYWVVPNRTLSGPNATTEPSRWKRSCCAWSSATTTIDWRNGNWKQLKFVIIRDSTITSKQDPRLTQKHIYTRIFANHIRCWLLCTPVIVQQVSVTTSEAAK